MAQSKFPYFLLAWLFCTWSPSPASAAVVINEIMANNVSAVLSYGDYPDWVELYNNGTTPVNLAGMTLTDNPSQPNKFIFPQDAVLGPKQCVVVWCDGKTGVPGYHASFSFNSSGEIISLYDAAGKVADSLTFGIQPTDFSLGRFPDGGTFALTRPTPWATNVVAVLGDPKKLKINEWMASPASGDDWLELFNPEVNPISIGGCVFSDATTTPSANRAIAAYSYMGPRSYFQFMASGLAKTNNEHLDFKLGAKGETITLFSTDRKTVLNRVKFGQQDSNVSEGRLPDGNDNILKFSAGNSTPAASNLTPISGLVINEVLTHTDFPLEDAVELYNTTDAPIDISGWWMSNSLTDYKKYHVPANTVIPAGGYKVFYELDFDPDNTGSGTSFRFNSAHGDECHFFATDAAGELTGGHLGLIIPPAQNGVSYGLIWTARGPEYSFLEERTFGVDNPISLLQFRLGKGKTNTPPRVGPIVLSEIMYHSVSDTATTQDAGDEYVELRNITSTAAPLYHILNVLSDVTNVFRLGGTISYRFPTNRTVPANGIIIVVGFNPLTETNKAASFRSRLDIPTNATLYGPFQGKLNNGGGWVQLLRPDEVQRPPHPDAGYTPILLAEEVRFDISVPWPTGADGLGQSLHRITGAAYADDVTNWFASAPTPGRLRPPLSPPVFQSITHTKTNILLTLSALAGTTYQVEASESLENPSWKIIGNAIGVGETNREVTLSDALLPAVSKKYYRISSPAH